MASPRVPDFQNSAGSYPQLKLGEKNDTQKLKIKGMIKDKSIQS